MTSINGGLSCTNTSPLIALSLVTDDEQHTFNLRGSTVLMVIITKEMANERHRRPEKTLRFP
ncbi:MAG: hypothetical protein ACTMIA_14995 [Vibrio sp.]